MTFAAIILASVGFTVPSAIPIDGVTTELRNPRVCLEGWRQSPVWAALHPAIRDTHFYRLYWPRVRREALEFRMNCQCVRTEPASRGWFDNVPPGTYSIETYQDGWRKARALTSRWIIVR